MLGGGSVPTQKIDSWCVSIEPEEMSVDGLASALRDSDPGVMGRIHNERLMLDIRTVQPRYDIELVKLFETLS